MNVFDFLAATGFYKFPQYDETNIASIQVGIANPKLAIESSGKGRNGYINGDDNGKYGMIVVGWEPAGGVSVVGDSSHIPEGHKIKLGMCGHNAYGAFAPFNCTLNPDETLAVDSKIDDGKPLSGLAVLTSDYYTYNADYSGCASGNNYNLSSAFYRECPLSIKFEP